MTDGFKFDTSLLCRASFPAELEEDGGRCIVEVTVYRLNAVAVHTFLMDGPEPLLRHLGLSEADTYITKHDIVPGFSDTMTASNFGNVSDIATRGDIALALINMVFETIGMVSIFAARNYGIRDVVLTGNLSSVPQAEEIFGTLNRMFDMRFTIPQNSRFGTVIGAALAGM